MARGNHRQPVFLAPRDYRVYLARFRFYRVEHQIAVYAYCLMPNHVHFLIQQGPVPVARFMQGLQQSYTQYFNRQHSTVGHLFQGRYKAIDCADDGYLAALVRYIHLNPVRAQLVSSPELYPYSGHSAYLSGRATRLVDPSRVLAIIGGPAG
jgi:putative transposase